MKRLVWNIRTQRGRFEKDIIDNLNRYNLSKKQYHTALQILKTNLKKYENAQLGFDKGIYSDTQVLETK